MSLHERIVVGPLQDRVQLAASHADVASTEYRKSESVVQQAAERTFEVIAVYSDDAHQIGHDSDRRLRSEDLGLDREFVRGGQVFVDRMAGAPSEAARCLYRGLRICHGVSDGLLFDDRANSSPSFATRKPQRDVEGSPHQSHAENPNQGRGSREARRCQGEAATLLAH